MDEIIDHIVNGSDLGETMDDQSHKQEDQGMFNKLFTRIGGIFGGTTSQTQPTDLTSSQGDSYMGQD